MASVRLANFCRSASKDARHASSSRAPSLRQLSTSPRRWDQSTLPTTPESQTAADRAFASLIDDSTLINYHNKRASMHRTSFEDLDGARRAVHAWGLHRKKNLTVMEAYSGLSNILSFKSLRPVALMHTPLWLVVGVRRIGSYRCWIPDRCHSRIAQPHPTRII
jgi:hypothetical protein